ncbi:hypothetical protein CANCADRAFT_33048 [Tortispora caseinolytica NRRL Y-17796]|uniref:RRM domain-containing protein n=1 Tax=Tortispora caseinolytica NRRL Y-17796 TaxID=767744 RepID=A0A1E4T9K1_9ASCO|nr:hypothetical protein CANCADRAFT_33048 [Tortispora caseinolytica NRRL Y-17796]
MPDSDNQPLRFHISPLSEGIITNPQGLENLFAEYGSILAGLEVHYTGVQTAFGFITLNTTPNGAAKLRSRLNNVRYKGVTLKVDLARESALDLYRKSIDASPNTVLHEHSNLRFPQPRGYKSLVLAGAMRKSPRKNIKKMSVRVPKGPRMIKLLPGLHKTRLWGITSKDTHQLTFFFDNGVWKDGEGNAVEYTHLDTDNATQLNSYTAKILDELVNKDTSKQDGPERIVQFGDDDEYTKIVQFKSSSAKQDPGESSDEDDLADILAQANENSPSSEKDQDMPEQTDNESESDQIVAPVPQRAAQTQVLHDLFRPSDDSSVFTLFGAPSVEEPAFMPVSKAVKQANEPLDHVAEKIPEQSKKLFFIHADSPFLEAKTVVATLPPLSNFDKVAWTNAFNEGRGEYVKELKMRKHDAKRRARKLNMAQGKFF